MAALAAGKRLRSEFMFLRLKPFPVIASDISSVSANVSVSCPWRLSGFLLVRGVAAKRRFVQDITLKEGGNQNPY